MRSPKLLISSCFCLSFFWLFVFLQFEISAEKYYFLPFISLIGIHLLASLRREYFFAIRPFKIVQALTKFVFWLLVLKAVRLLYSEHQFYSNLFPEAGFFFDFCDKVYLIGAFPYFLITPNAALIWPSLIGVFLRVHFFALMMSQLKPAWSSLVGSVSGSTWSWPELFKCVVIFAWCVDGGNASMGYLVESNLIKTRFRAIDRDIGSWIATLSCYFPFAMWAGLFFPQMEHSIEMLLPTVSAQFGWTSLLDLILLLSLFGYVAAGSSLGFATSNLSFKFVQDRGPYAVVRHPAITCKIIFFLGCLLKSDYFRQTSTILVFAFWVGIYIARALFEEKFLRQFVEYQTYTQKVKYRFIPFLV